MHTGFELIQRNHPSIWNKYFKREVLSLEVLTAIQELKNVDDVHLLGEINKIVDSKDEKFKVQFWMILCTVFSTMETDKWNSLSHELSRPPLPISMKSSLALYLSCVLNKLGLLKSYLHDFEYDTDVLLSAFKHASRSGSWESMEILLQFVEDKKIHSGFFRKKEQTEDILIFKSCLWYCKFDENFVEMAKRHCGYLIKYTYKFIHKFIPNQENIWNTTLESMVTTCVENGDLELLNYFIATGMLQNRTTLLTALPNAIADGDNALITFILQKSFAVSTFIYELNNLSCLEWKYLFEHFGTEEYVHSILIQETFYAIFPLLKTAFDEENKEWIEKLLFVVLKTKGRLEQWCNMYNAMMMKYWLQHRNEWNGTICTMILPLINYELLIPLLADAFVNQDDICISILVPPLEKNPEGCKQFIDANCELMLTIWMDEWMKNKSKSKLLLFRDEYLLLPSLLRYFDEDSASAGEKSSFEIVRFFFDVQDLVNFKAFMRHHHTFVARLVINEQFETVDMLCKDLLQEKVEFLYFNDWFFSKKLVTKEDIPSVLLLGLCTFRESNRFIIDKCLQKCLNERNIGSIGENVLQKCLSKSWLHKLHKEITSNQHIQLSIWNEDEIEHLQLHIISYLRSTVGYHATITHWCFSYASKLPQFKELTGPVVREIVKEFSNRMFESLRSKITSDGWDNVHKFAYFYQDICQIHFQSNRSFLAAKYLASLMEVSIAFENKVQEDELLSVLDTLPNEFIVNGFLDSTPDKMLHSRWKLFHYFSAEKIVQLMLFTNETIGFRTLGWCMFARILKKEKSYYLLRETDDDTYSTIKNIIEFLLPKLLSTQHWETLLSASPNPFSCFNICFSKWSLCLLHNIDHMIGGSGCILMFPQIAQVIIDIMVSCTNQEFVDHILTLFDTSILSNFFMVNDFANALRFFHVENNQLFSSNYGPELDEVTTRMKRFLRCVNEHWEDDVKFRFLLSQGGILFTFTKINPLEFSSWCNINRRQELLPCILESLLRRKSMKHIAKNDAEQILATIRNCGGYSYDYLPLLQQHALSFVRCIREHHYDLSFADWFFHLYKDHLNNDQDPEILNVACNVAIQSPVDYEEHFAEVVFIEDLKTQLRQFIPIDTLLKVVDDEMILNQPIDLIINMICELSATSKNTNYLDHDIRVLIDKYPILAIVGMKRNQPKIGADCREQFEATFTQLKQNMINQYASNHMEEMSDFRPMRMMRQRANQSAHEVECIVLSTYDQEYLYHTFRYFVGYNILRCEELLPWIKYVQNLNSKMMQYFETNQNFIVQQMIRQYANRQSTTGSTSTEEPEEEYKISRLITHLCDCYPRVWLNYFTSASSPTGITASMFNMEQYITNKMPMWTDIDNYYAFTDRDALVAYYCLLYNIRTSAIPDIEGMIRKFFGQYNFQELVWGELSYSYLLLLQEAIQAQNTQAREMLELMEFESSNNVQDSYYESNSDDELFFIPDQAAEDEEVHDQESSMHITTPENAAYDKLCRRYEKICQQRFPLYYMQENIMKELEKQYYNEPAQIELIDPVDFSVVARTEEAESNTTARKNTLLLPLHYEEFIAMSLSPETRQRAYVAYYKHLVHCAWRLLLEQNTWMNHTATFVLRTTATATITATAAATEGAAADVSLQSNFRKHVTLINVMYAAVIDTSPMSTQRDRWSLLISALKEILRAHNTDTIITRTETGLTGEYDNLLPDEPSCSLGFKRRLLRALLGNHPDMIILTSEVLYPLISSFVTAHFHSCIQSSTYPIEEIKASFETFVVGMMESHDDNPISPILQEVFMIPEATVTECEQTILMKYGELYTSSTFAKEYVNEIFTPNPTFLHNFGSEISKLLPNE